MTKTRLLFVEDDADDVLFLMRACRKAGVTETPTFLANGKRAIEYLQPKLQNPAAQDPFLIFLDLNMPEMNGFDFLRWLRNSPNPARIPVVILSTSENPLDIKTAYELGANAYLVKPGGASELNEMISAAYSFWARYNRISAQ